MPQPPLDLYIYLLRRDKKGVKILSLIKGKPLIPTKIVDAAELNLPGNLAKEINNAIFDSRMMWECWAETTDTFENLRKSLTKRGYVNIPSSNQPELKYSGSKLPVANVSKISKQSVMLQNAHKT